jgi:imidazole glycerol-phosphate synthase subunit HisF
VVFGIVNVLMLKKRIIPKILIRKKNLQSENLIVSLTTKKFKDNKIIGDPTSQATIFNDSKADEIILIDLDHSILDQDKLELISNISKNIFIPFTVGGGVKTIDDIRILLSKGADRVIINTSVLNSYTEDLIQKASNYFGSQCIVASVDIKSNDKNYSIYDYSNKNLLDISIKDFMIKLQNLNIGEIMITDVNRDGCQVGFDKNFFDIIKEFISVPIIISGGCANFNDFLFAFNFLKVDGVASGTFFSQHDQSVFQTKNHLSDLGIAIRLDY